PVARRLVVEREAAAVVPDPGQSRGESQPALAGRAAMFWRRLSVDGMEWVGGPGMLEVGENQFLVLLFVMNAQQDRRRDLPQDCVTGLSEEMAHVLVHVGTV